jgi:hypothetical protein
MGATESALRDKALRRHKPSAWIARLGVHSRIRKGRNYVQVRQGKFFKNRFILWKNTSLPSLKKLPSVSTAILVIPVGVGFASILAREISDLI